jgi:DNA-binding transcriptional regulator YiaG
MNINKNKKIEKATDFQALLKEMLKDKEFKKYYDEYGRQLEIAYQVLQLRKKAKMSQAELARKIGTT